MNLYTCLQRLQLKSFLSYQDHGSIVNSILRSNVKFLVIKISNKSFPVLDPIGSSGFPKSGSFPLIKELGLGTVWDCVRLVCIRSRSRFVLRPDVGNPPVLSLDYCRCSTLSGIFLQNRPTILYGITITSILICFWRCQHLWHLSWSDWLFQFLKSPVGNN